MNSEPKDPIVAEIRAVRRELTARFGDDIDALCDFLVEREKEHAALLVNHPPKVPQYVSSQNPSKRRTG